MKNAARNDSSATPADVSTPPTSIHADLTQFLPASAEDLGDQALSRKTQKQFLLLLSRGAPPQGACHQLGISLLSLARTLEQDDTFRSERDHILDLLSQNVAMALYQAAMKGDIHAQKFYLTNAPPPEWTGPSDSAPPSPDDLADDELLQCFQREAPLLLAELARQGAATDGGDLGGPISPSPPSPGT